MHSAKLLERRKVVVEAACGFAAFLIGFYGLGLVFSDYSSLVLWIAQLALVFVLVPLTLGFIAHGRWWVSALVAWGPVLLVLVVLLSLVLAVGGTWRGAGSAQEVEVLRGALYLLVLVGVAGLAVLAAYAGARLRRARVK